LPFTPVGVSLFFFFCLSPRIESDSQILQADEYLHDRIRLCRLIESDSRLPAIADTRQGEVLEGPAATGEDGRRGKGIRCSSAACSWATDKWACMCGAVSGTPLQGTQLQRISFRRRGGRARGGRSGATCASTWPPSPYGTRHPSSSEPTPHRRK